MVTYTPAELVVIIAAVSGAIVNIIGVWRNGSKTDKVAAAINGTPSNPGLVGHVSKIHELTNSTMTEVRNELKVALQLNVSLQEIIQDLKGERAKKEMKDAFIAVPIKAEPPIPIVMEVKKMDVQEFNTGQKDQSKK